MLSALNVNPANSMEDFALSSFIANAVNRVVFVDGDVVIRQVITRRQRPPRYTTFRYRAAWPGERGEAICFINPRAVALQGDLGEAMYFIAEGQVEVLYVRGGNNEGAEQLAVLGPHSFFGEMGLLHPEGRSMATCRTIDFCSGWELRLAAYEMAVKRFPHFR